MKVFDSADLAPPMIDSVSDEEKFALELYQTLIKEFMGDDVVDEYVLDGHGVNLKTIEERAERIALVCFKLAKGFRKAKLVAFK